MSSPEIEAAMAREAYFQYLSEVITCWQSDPKAYDLKLVAHEIQKTTGQASVEALRPGDFIALLRRCRLRNSNPPEPVPPKSAVEMRRERAELLLERERVLLAAQPLFYLPALHRRPLPQAWRPVEPRHPGAATAQAVIFDRPDAPVDEVVLIAAELGFVDGSNEQRSWYRAYCKVRRSDQVEVLILGEGTTGSPTGSRMAVGRKVYAFLREQCDAEPLLDTPPATAPPPKSEVYSVQVRVELSKRDVDDLFRWSHRAETSTVVAQALKRHAAQVRRLREERAAARKARRAAAGSAD